MDLENRSALILLSDILLTNLIATLSVVWSVQDVYFDDDSAQVVISNLRLSDDQGR